MSNTILKEVIDFLEKEILAYKADVYAPYNLISWAQHVFNLYNQKAQVFKYSGSTQNLRLHLMSIAPPGQSKTYWHERFLADSVTAILSGTGTNIRFIGTITEASFVGTFDRMERLIINKDGIVTKYKDYIVGCNEFTFLISAMKAQHSSPMRSQLLEILDTGRVIKDIASGSIADTTYITLWANTQPVNIDVDDGLGRRFIYTIFIPTEKDRKEIRHRVHQSRNKDINMYRLEKIREELRHLTFQIRCIDKIDVDNDVLEDMFEELGIEHYEVPWFDGLLIGYSILTDDFSDGKTLYIDVYDEDLMRILQQSVRWRREIMIYGQDIVPLKLVENSGGAMTIDELMIECTKLSLSYDLIMKQLQKLISKKILLRDKDVVYVRWLK